MDIRNQLEQFLVHANGETVYRELGSPWLNDLIPGLAALLTCDHGTQRHLEGDVARHTALVYTNMLETAERRYARRPEFVELLSVLLHDLRKPDTRTPHPDGDVTFPGHEMLAGGDADRLSARLKLTPDETACLSYLVRRHGDAHSWPALSEEQRLELAKSPWLPSLALLQEADALSCILPGGSTMPVYFREMIELHEMDSRDG